MVQHLGHNTETNENEAIEQKWHTLSSMLIKLKQLQDAAKIITIPSSGLTTPIDNEGEFDDIELASADEILQLNQTMHCQNTNVMEWEVLLLPSSGNVMGEPAQVEIHQQKQQAHWQIVWLRDIITDISFQYSHVIQGAI